MTSNKWTKFFPSSLARIKYIVNVLILLLFRLNACCSAVRLVITFFVVIIVILYFSLIRYGNRTINYMLQARHTLLYHFFRRRLTTIACILFIQFRSNVAIDIILNFIFLTYFFHFIQLFNQKLPSTTSDCELLRNSVKFPTKYSN